MNLDIDFSLPFRHRVRFTNDLAVEQFDVLVDLVNAGEPSAAPIGPHKMLVVVDSAVVAAHSRIGPQTGSEESSGGTSGWLLTLLDKLSATDSISLLDCSAFNRKSNAQPTQAQHVIPALTIDGGESCKNDVGQVERVLAMINHFDVDRRSYVLAIGGGAVLDAVGYAAAIAHRGVRLIRIPTTTLAQDDSGVGVKNAINYFNKKNWVGTFAVPWGVINDARVLESLDDRDFRCGFSEAVKVSLLKSETDFDYLVAHASQIFDRQMDVAFEAIKRSCLWHLKHITQGGDPFELLEARPLDFGHWSAHKMESLTDYQLRHGEAVGMGVALDCLYSTRMFGLPEADTVLVLQCLGRLGIPLWHDVLDQPDDVLQGLEEFRQHLGGRLTVTMLEKIGRPIDVHEIDFQQMRAAILDLKQFHSTLELAR